MCILICNIKRTYYLIHTIQYFVSILHIRRNALLQQYPSENFIFKYFTRKRGLSYVNFFYVRLIYLVQRTYFLVGMTYKLVCLTYHLARIKYYLVIMTFYLIRTTKYLVRLIYNCTSLSTPPYNPLPITLALTVTLSLLLHTISYLLH